jgi:predicted Zn-dependent protease with MMP-like domain
MLLSFAYLAFSAVLRLLAGRRRSEVAKDVELLVVEIVVEDEPPPGQRLRGLYQGVPLTRRSSHYGGVLPDKITIYCGPLVRLYAHDPERLRRESSRL